MGLCQHGDLNPSHGHWIFFMVLHQYINPKECCQQQFILRPWKLSDEVKVATLAALVLGGAAAPGSQDGIFIHGYQIWLALPEALRLCPADSIDWQAHETPTVTSPDGLVWARVISSELPVMGATCKKIPTEQPIQMVHFIVQVVVGSYR